MSTRPDRRRILGVAADKKGKKAFRNHIPSPSLLVSRWVVMISHSASCCWWFREKKSLRLWLIKWGKMIVSLGLFSCWFLQPEVTGFNFCYYVLAAKQHNKIVWTNWAISSSHSGRKLTYDLQWRRKSPQAAEQTWPKPALDWERDFNSKVRREKRWLCSVPVYDWHVYVRHISYLSYLNSRLLRLLFLMVLRHSFMCFFAC